MRPKTPEISDLDLPHHTVRVPVVPGSALPAEAGLSLYLASRHLMELQAILQLSGLPTWYERPGARGIERPRLHVSQSEAICVTPWFEWQQDRRGICPAADLPRATDLIAEYL